MSDAENLIGVYLYRITDNDGGSYYGSMRKVEAVNDVEVIGVAFRPAYTSIKGDTEREGFETAVGAVAEDVRWFDTSVET